MYELPKELSNSLRSWRGSVHATNSQPLDIERGPELAPSETSEIPHPTESKHHLRTSEGDDASIIARRPSAQQTAPKDEHPNVQAKSQEEQKPGDHHSNNLPHNADDDKPLQPHEFYELMGMRPPGRDGQMPDHFAIKNGLYATIAHRESYVNKKYKTFDIATYLLLVLQLLLSAVFIVLGSLSTLNSHLAIAVLGAVSTIVAGSLALMKGQGLPYRLRKTREGLRKVIFDEHLLYWDVYAGRAVNFSQVKQIRTDYLEVIRQADLNHPDVWNTNTTSIAQGVASRVSGHAGNTGIGAATREGLRPSAQPAIHER